MFRLVQYYLGLSIVLIGLLGVPERGITSDDTRVGIPSIMTTSRAVIDPNGEAPGIEQTNIAPATGHVLLGAPISPDLRDEDAAIAHKLREFIATALINRIPQHEDRIAIEAFYRDRAFVPLWITNAEPSARAKEVIAFLRGVGSDALDPADYPTPNFGIGSSEALAADEITLTNSVLTFARHAQVGRLSYARVSKNISYDILSPNPIEILNKVASAREIRHALDSYNPQQPGYKALKATLANELDKLRNNETNDRVSAQRSPRSGASQKVSMHLRSEARVRSQSIDAITVNMERWRWLPRDLGNSYVIVNIPDYSLKVVENERTVWSTRIVVGKVGSSETPLLSENMKSITINPTWSVPPSIIRKEYLPALREDRGALTRLGLRIGRNQDGSLRVYQPPGDRNALGNLRFNFPNKFLVYQHDTPTKHLFARNKRAFSHGCMRVQEPDKYAEVLLSISQPMEGYTVGRIRRSFGAIERTIPLKYPFPVHVTYQTAFIDEVGKLQIREDVYGLDKLVLNALDGRERIADALIARN